MRVKDEERVKTVNRQSREEEEKNEDNGRQARRRRKSGRSVNQSEVERKGGRVKEE